MRRKRHWTYSGEKRRLAVLRRDNYTCQIGGPDCMVVANTVDHIHPKAWGGTEDETNLRAACWNCNQRKGARATGERSALAAPPPFFSHATHRRAPLLKVPPRSRWGVIRSDYSRRDASGDDRSA